MHSINPRSLPPDPRVARPKTLSAALLIVEQTFREQGWNDDERRRYVEMHDGDLTTVEGVRAVLAAMEESRMVIYK